MIYFNFVINIYIGGLRQGWPTPNSWEKGEGEEDIFCI
jgi:hypothetical protein